MRGFNLCQVIDSFDDTNYRNFLKFVDSKVNRSTSRRYWSTYRCDKIRNIGTFLSKIKNYPNYEQFFACGIEEIDDNINFKISDVPKGLLKICKDYNIKLTNDLINAYKVCPNDFNNLVTLDFTTLRKSIAINILEDSINKRSDRWFNNYLFNLCNTFNYQLKSLFIYIDNLMTYEALDGDVYHNIIREIYDYVNMMSKISPKYDKYPKNFLTTHKIAVRNYNRLIETFNEEVFKTRINKDMEYTYKEYKFVYPNTTQDIKNEAVQQNNCVASYIKKVVDGECHILFMRNKKDLEKSLVTIEVKNGKIVQAKGKFNRDVTTKEQEAIEHWNTHEEKRLSKEQNNIKTKQDINLEKEIAC